jgi:hypothetical protein
MDASRPTAVVSESWTRMFFARENAKHAYDTRTMAPSFWRKLHFSEFAKSTSYLFSTDYLKSPNGVTTALRAGPCSVGHDTPVHHINSG